MSDQPASPTPMLNADGKLRMSRFMVATVASMFVIAGATAVLVHAAAPEGGWAVALGIGAMIGFWMCPLAGAVIGNGYHEIAAEREGHGHSRATATVDLATDPNTASTIASPMSHAGRLEQHTSMQSAAGQGEDRGVEVG